MDGLDPETHTRCRALCLARLAELHLATGALDDGARWARQALGAAGAGRGRRRARQALTAADGVRSGRLTYAVTQVRAAAAGRPELGSLVDEIDTVTGAAPP